jgi:hypothetical protein
MATFPGALGVGIVLGLVGSVFINVGNNIQALGLTRLEIQKATSLVEALASGLEGCIDDEIDACESPVWLAGTIMFLTGSIINFVAFAFAPQSILASLEGIQVKHKFYPIRLHALTLQYINPGILCSSLFFLLSQFVTNVLFGKFVLSSNVTITMYIGTAVTCAGIVVIVLACRHVEPPSGIFVLI